MISFNIPSIGDIELENAVFDLNGTIALNGVIPEDVRSKLNTLSHNLNVYVLTADTYGTAQKIVSGLNAEIARITPVDEPQKKRDFILHLGKKKTVAVGNGANDILMLLDARIGIAIIGKEGASTEAVGNADIVVNSALDAIDLLLYPMRIISTLRR